MSFGTCGRTVSWNLRISFCSSPFESPAIRLPSPEAVGAPVTEIWLGARVRLMQGLNGPAAMYRSSASSPLSAFVLSRTRRFGLARESFPEGEGGERGSRLVKLFRIVF